MLTSIQNHEHKWQEWARKMCICDVQIMFSFAWSPLNCLVHEFDNINFMNIIFTNIISWDLLLYIFVPFSKIYLFFFKRKKLLQGKFTLKGPLVPYLVLKNHYQWFLSCSTEISNSPFSLEVSASIDALWKDPILLFLITLLKF